MRRGWLGAGTIVFAAVLSGAAYRYGMFFDEVFYRWEWLLCLAGMCGAFTIGAALIRNRMRAGIAPFSEQTASIPAAVYGLLLIAAFYGLAALHEPASLLGSLQQMLRWSAYAAFLFILYAAFGQTSHRVWLSAGIYVSGLFVMGCALAGWLGALSFPDMIMTTGDPRLSVVGARLAGFLQYPNVLGAAACAYVVWSGSLLLRAKTKASFLLHAIGIVPFMLTALLTESRGAWLAAAAAWLAGLLLLGRLERSAWLLYTGWALLCGGAAYRFVVHAGVRASAAEGRAGATVTEELLLILICAAAPVGFLGLRRLLAGPKVRLVQAVAWGGCSAAVLLSLLVVLPSSIHGRLYGFSGVYDTFAARGLFYADAGKLIQEALFFGRGGDTWRVLFTGIQSQPYVGNEVHSGLMELVLDLGVMGLLVAAAVLFILLSAVWRGNRLGLLPIGILLLHAAIDFDMEYGYYWLLLLGWAVVSSSGEERGGVRGRARVRAWRAAGAGAAAVCFAAAALLGWRFDAAVRHREAAAAASGAARTAALRAALDANPYWTPIRIELADHAPPSERAVLLTSGLRYEPQSVPLLRALGRECAERSDVIGAADYWRRALAYDRFDWGSQSEAVVTMAQLAQNLRAASRLAEANLAAETAALFFERYEALKKPYTANDRKFAVTDAAQKAAAQNRQLLAQLGTYPLAEKR
ncbi:O-antigen ligase family protein [Paenibacillus sp. R14(2021)]|uniref:O-antigen ligase family protein n=1 Tax=Paenibacillus sp. R14(2021) TaxID=2859228 RepID=UPI001C613EFC|nr:O-antigen ligase family protein [Paenibacillus sp. R14(2021)]